MYECALFFRLLPPPPVWVRRVSKAHTYVMSGKQSLMLMLWHGSGKLQHMYTKVRVKRKEKKGKNVIFFFFVNDSIEMCAHLANLRKK